MDYRKVLCCKILLLLLLNPRGTKEYTMNEKNVSGDLEEDENE